MYEHITIDEERIASLPASLGDVNVETVDDDPAINSDVGFMRLEHIGVEGTTAAVQQIIERRVGRIVADTAPGIFSILFPNLFARNKGDCTMTHVAHDNIPQEAECIRYLLRVQIGGAYPYQKHPRFLFYALNRRVKRDASGLGAVFVKHNARSFPIANFNAIDRYGRLRQMCVPGAYVITIPHAAS